MMATRPSPSPAPNPRNQPAKAPAGSQPNEVELLRQGRDVDGTRFSRQAVAKKDQVSGGYRLGSSTTVKDGFAPSDPEVKDDPKVQAGRRRPDRQNTQDFPKPVDTSPMSKGPELTAAQKNSARKQALSKNTITFTRKEGTR